MKTDNEHEANRLCNFRRDQPHSGLSTASSKHRISYPRSWYYFSSAKELLQGPVTKEILGKRLTGFITSSGKPGVLESRCAHMGSDLGKGCVVGESLQCALHHWQFGIDGRCVLIPSMADIPSFARQISYPAELLQGSVFFFLGQEADYPLPFFEGLDPDDCVAAAPFVDIVQCPWYMIGANAVDVQHFSIAHDRRMTQPPDVSYPAPFAHQAVCHFEVAGNSWSDQLTRRFGGRDVRLQLTDWGGTMILAMSTLARTETYGMVCVVPVGPAQTMVHVTVMARSSEGAIRSRLLDPMRARVRRALISKFLRSDIDRLSGADFRPHTLIGIDAHIANYFNWLKGLRWNEAGEAENQ